MDSELVILTDQAAALRRIEQLSDDELWRTDKRTRWMQMLRRLVYAMDWTTGLVCGVTLAQLAEAGGCSPRTVSRLLAWAQEAELIVVVETGAAATFLGSRTNRAPAYVLVASPAPPSNQPVDGDDHQPAAAVEPVAEFAHFTGGVDESGDLPQSYVSSKPLTGRRRLDKPSPAKTDWGLWQIPTTPAERSVATEAFLGRIGFRGQVPAWRAQALLYQWWNAGVCVAGLLHMVDHYPGQPDQSRGNGLRGATDPLRVLGHRLRPWVGGLDALPDHFIGQRGDYRTAQAARLADRVAARQRRADAPRPASGSSDAREAARAAIAELLAGRAQRRRRG